MPEQSASGQNDNCFGARTYRNDLITSVCSAGWCPCEGIWGFDARSLATLEGARGLRDDASFELTEYDHGSVTIWHGIVRSVDVGCFVDLTC